MRGESKGELTTRLRQEGRWDAFVKRREQLKAEGARAKDAWEQAAAEFPPVDVPVGAAVVVVVDPVELEALRGKEPVGMLEAVRWVFNFACVPWVKPGDAPSAGAWGLLQWAKRNPASLTEFYRTFAARLLTVAEPEPEPEHGTDPQTKRLLDMLDGCRRQRELGELR
jgi:hypothetical protein